MKERSRVAEVVRRLRTLVELYSARFKAFPADRVAVFPNQIVVTFKGREYTITVTENRKSRLK